MHAAMKLGRRHAVHDPRTLQLAKYVDHKQASMAPAIVDFTDGVRWGMYRNDELGICTIASACNLVRAWTVAGKHHEIDITEESALAAYEKVSGYRPGEPDTDQGAIELTVLRFWKRAGIGRHKIAAFASVEPGSRGLLRDACWLFTGLYAGVALPLSAQGQAVWEVPPGGAQGTGAKGSWGGHAVPILGVDDRGITVVTWGAVKRASWGFVEAYFDEAYAILSRDFLDASGAGPSGFRLAELRADLALVLASRGGCGRRRGAHPGFEGDAVQLARGHLDALAVWRLDPDARVVSELDDLARRLLGRARAGQDAEVEDDGGQEREKVAHGIGR